MNKQETSETASGPVSDLTGLLGMDTTLNRAADMLTAYAELVRRQGASQLDEHYYPKFYGGRHRHRVMCNMPFFADRLEWGTSIRGAWWGAMPGSQIEFDSCGLWVGDEQLTDTLKFSADEWKRFIAAVIEFVHLDV